MNHFQSLVDYTDYKNCPMCRELLHHAEPQTMLRIGNETHIYHDDCYKELLRRLDLFWEKLTGPQEEFEAWLAEEEE